MINNDSLNLNDKGIKEVDKVKKVKEILFYGSILGFLGLSAVFISWFINTEIGKSPLTWSIISAVGFLLMIIFNIEDIPFLKRNINKKIKNKKNFHNYK